MQQEMIVLEKKISFAKMRCFKIIGQLIEVCLLLIARQPVFEKVLTTSLNCTALPYDKIPF